MTLYKYILNEIWPTFFASLFVMVFIMVASQMLSITELVITRGVGVAQVVGIVIYLLPDIVAFALPAVSLIAVLVAFLRLSADSEIIALKSCGVSLYQMLPPVVGLSFLGLLFALVMGVFVAPWGNRSFKDLIFRIAESEATVGIKERVFSEPFDNVVFYVNRYSSREKLLKDVFVVDRRDKRVTNTIVAEEGRILLHPNERIITLRFLRGTIFLVEKDLKSTRTIGFKSYDLNISLKDILAGLASRKKKPHELSVGELLKQLEETPKGEVRYNEIMRELLEKGSMPLAVFLMGIIGVPLGARLRARGRSAGIGVSLAIFSVYYLCLAGMRSICSTGILSPAIGVWIPDFFLLISCIYLLRRAAEERPINFLAGLKQKMA
ncbi:MAG: LPS export ABC transporter permease LptF [Desulfatiglandaceae bacterium]